MVMYSQLFSYQLSDLLNLVLPTCIASMYNINAFCVYMFLLAMIIIIIILPIQYYNGL